MKKVKGIWFPDADTHFEHAIDNEGNYQKNQFDAALEYIKPSDRDLFIDIGAHVGLWSRMAHKAGFNQIMAFEPNSDNYKCLERNSVDNEDYINCLPIGLSDKKEYVYFKLGKDTNSGSSETMPNGGTRLWKFDELMLDNYLSNMDFKSKVLVKVDVQGYEEKVMRGMQKFIKEYRPIVIIEQVLNGKWDLGAADFLKSLGMKELKIVGKEVILGW